MINHFKNLYRQEYYHGQSKNDKFFEGWYLKINDSENHFKFCFIFGIYKSKKKELSHSFIQILDGQGTEVKYYKFGIEAFSSSRKYFELKIGKNKLAFDELIIDIDNFKIDIKFGENICIPNKLLKPGIMGLFSLYPFFDCYHSVINLKSNIDGCIKIDKKFIDFNLGNAYLEKDWGREFPSDYFWFQAANFRNSDLIISGVYSKVRQFGINFRVHLIVIYFQSEFHYFRYSDSSKIVKFEEIDNQIEFQFKKGNKLINLTITKSNKKFNLLAPINNRMQENTPQFIESNLNITFLENNQIILEDYSDDCTLENAGKI